MSRNMRISCLILMWVVVSGATFWWYQFRFYTRFSETTAVFEASDLPVPMLGSGSKAIKLLHFWQPDCFCDGPATEHLQEVLEAYPHQAIALFVLADEPPPSGWLAREYTFLLKANYPELARVVPSSPALAIWGSDNQLAYFGPYSVGPICSQETSFVPGVLSSLQLGETVQMTSLVGSGCFCPWPGSANS